MLHTVTAAAAVAALALVGMAGAQPFWPPFDWSTRTGERTIEAAFKPRFVSFENRTYPMSYALSTDSQFSALRTPSNQSADFYPSRLLINIAYSSVNNATSPAPAPFPNGFNVLCITSATTLDLPAGGRQTACIDVADGNVLATLPDKSVTFLGVLPALTANGTSLFLDMASYPQIAGWVFPAVQSTEITFNVGGSLYACSFQAVLLSPSSPPGLVSTSAAAAVPSLLSVRTRPIVRELGFFANSQAARPEMGTEPVHNNMEVEDCRIRCWQSRTCQGFNFLDTIFKFNSSIVETPSRCVLFDYGPVPKYADVRLANLPTYFDGLSTFYERVDALHEYRVLPNAAGWPISQLLARNCTSAAEASVGCLYSVAGCQSFDFEPSTGKCTFFSYRALSDRRVRRAPGTMHYDIDPLNLRVGSTSIGQPPGLSYPSTKALRLASSACSPLSITASSDPTCLTFYDLAVEERSPFGDFAGGMSTKWRYTDTFMRLQENLDATFNNRFARWYDTNDGRHVLKSIHLKPDTQSFHSAFAAFVLSDQSTTTAIDMTSFTVELDLAQRRGNLVGLGLLAESQCSGSATIFAYSAGHGRVIQMLKVAVSSEQPTAFMLPLEDRPSDNVRVRFAFDQCNALVEIVPYVASRETLSSPLASARANSEFYFVTLSDAEIAARLSVLPANRMVFAVAFLGEFAEVTNKPSVCSKGTERIASLSTKWNAPGFTCELLEMSAAPLANFLHWFEAIDVAGSQQLWPALQPLRAVIATRLLGDPAYKLVNMAAFSAMPNYLRASTSAADIESSTVNPVLYEGIAIASKNGQSLDALVDAQRASLNGADSYALLQRVQYRYIRASSGFGPVLIPYYCSEGYALVNQLCIKPETAEDRVALLRTYLQYASTPSVRSIERVLDYVVQHVTPSSSISAKEKLRAGLVLSVAVATATTPALRPLLSRASDLLAGLNELLLLRPDSLRQVPSISGDTFVGILQRASLIFKEIMDQSRYESLQQALSDISKEFNENLVTMQSSILDQISEGTRVTTEYIRDSIKAQSENIAENLGRMEKSMQKSNKDTAATMLRSQAENAKIMASGLIKEIMETSRAMVRRLKDSVFTLSGEGGLDLVKSIQERMENFRSAVKSAAMRLGERRKDQRSLETLKIAASTTRMASEIAEAVDDATKIGIEDIVSFGATAVIQVTAAVAKGAAASATFAAEWMESAIVLEGIDLQERATGEIIDQDKDQTQNLRNLKLFVQFFTNLGEVFQYLGSTDQKTTLDSIDKLERDSASLVSDADNGFLKSDNNLKSAIQRTSTLSPDEIKAIDDFATPREKGRDERYLNNVANRDGSFRLLTEGEVDGAVGGLELFVDQVCADSELVQHGLTALCAELLGKLAALKVGMIDSSRILNEVWSLRDQREALIARYNAQIRSYVGFARAEKTIRDSPAIISALKALPTLSNPAVAISKLKELSNNVYATLALRNQVSRYEISATEDFMIAIAKQACQALFFETLSPRWKNCEGVASELRSKKLPNDITGVNVTSRLSEFYKAVLTYTMVADQGKYISLVSSSQLTDGQAGSALKPPFTITSIDFRSFDRPEKVATPERMIYVYNNNEEINQMLDKPGSLRLRVCPPGAKAATVPVSEFRYARCLTSFNSSNIDEYYNRRVRIAAAYITMGSELSGTEGLRPISALGIGSIRGIIEVEGIQYKQDKSGTLYGFTKLNTTFITPYTQRLDGVSCTADQRVGRFCTEATAAVVKPALVSDYIIRFRFNDQPQTIAELKFLNKSIALDLIVEYDGELVASRIRRRMLRLPASPRG